MSASVTLLVAAACCWWLSLADAAFVLATMGIVFWFLSLRNRLRMADIEGGDGDVERQKPSHNNEEELRKTDEN